MEQKKFIVEQYVNDYMTNPIDRVQSYCWVGKQIEFFDNGQSPFNNTICIWKVKSFHSETKPKYSSTTPY
jgi:hypothetical protein